MQAVPQKAQAGDHECTTDWNGAMPPFCKHIFSKRPAFGADTWQCWKLEHSVASDHIEVSLITKSLDSRVHAYSMGATM